MNTHLLIFIPTASNYIMNICLLGVGVFLFIMALALFSYLLDCCIRIFDSFCNWLEYKLQRRKVRRRLLSHLERISSRSSSTNSPHPPSVSGYTSSAKRAAVLPFKARRQIDAREALRRSASQGENQPKFPRGA